VVVTLHRPSNVDDPATLQGLLEGLADLAEERRVVFPVHPRTRARIEALHWQPRTEQFALIDPLSYADMLSLVIASDLVITDSGGLQEETSFLGIPCLTVRPNTERPITCVEGTNRLVGPGADALRQAAREVWGRRRTPPARIERWDGKAAERIAAVLCDGARFDPTEPLQ
jgi:UDP-N-acetylglucosamine 2-epimerase (non-hydrolysing)